MSAEPFRWRAIATLIGLTATASPDLHADLKPLNAPKHGRSRFVHPQLALKIRYLFAADRRTVGELLFSKLSSANGGKARDVSVDYAADLARVREIRNTTTSDVAALREAHRQHAIVGPGEKRDMERDPTRPLQKWFERAEVDEFRRESDGAWLDGLRRLLGKSGAEPK